MGIETIDVGQSLYRDLQDTGSCYIAPEELTINDSVAEKATILLRTSDNEWDEIGHGSEW